MKIVKIVLSLPATLALLACGSAQKDPSGDVRFVAEGVTAAGVEALLCAYVAMPDDGNDIYVDSARSTYSGQSHHFVAFRTNLDSLPENAGALRECSERTWQSNVAGYYFEAQSPSVERTLPTGVAHRFAPREILMLQLHVVNVQPTPALSHVELTLRRTPKADVTSEAGTIFFYDPKIDVPPRGSSTSLMRCPVSQDMNLALLWSHMHSRGARFRARVEEPGMADRPLYETDDWAEPVARLFTEPTVVRAGSNIVFSCDFQNAGDDRFVSGPSARTDEMCVLHGMYWPRASLAVELCDRGTTEGAGRTPARATLSCLMACNDGVDCKARCWDGACPTAGPRAYAYLRCVQRADRCESSCRLLAGASCDACAARECAAETTALEDSACE